MKSTSLNSKPASSLYIFKCWVKDQWHRAFSSNRKTVVLDDPQTLIAEAEAAGKDPYKHISRRKVAPNPTKKPAFQRVNHQSAFREASSKLNNQKPIRSQQLRSLHQELLKQANLHCQSAFHQGPWQDFKIFNELRQALNSEDWKQSSLNIIRKHSDHLPQDFITLSESLAALLTQQTKQRTTKATYIKEHAQWVYLRNHVHLLTGDITRINDGEVVKSQTIVCPHTSKRSRRRHETEIQLQPIDKVLQDEDCLEKIAQLKTGTAIIRRSRGLAPSYGFTDVIDVSIPGKNTMSIDKKFFCSYQACIWAAHKNRKTSVAIPILTTGINMKPERSASLACLAIKRYLSDPKTPDRPLAIHLVCPPTEEGYAIQQKISGMLD